MPRGEAREVNYKRGERVWRQARLKVPGKQPKRGRLWLHDGSSVRFRPEPPSHRPAAAIAEPGSDSLRSTLRHTQDTDTLTLRLA
jgi:hypothetical protein